MYAVKEEKEPLLSSKEDSKKYTIYGSILISIFISCFIIAGFISKHSIIQSENVLPNANKIISNDQLDTEANAEHSLNSISLKSHQKIFGEQKIETVIRYEADSSPYEEYWMNHEEWNRFHADLVDKEGYSIDDKKRSFVFEINDGKREQTLKAQSQNNGKDSNLECFTRYAFTEGNKDDLEPGATVGVNCLNDDDGLEPAQMVGCVTYHPDNYGYTSGETLGWMDIVGRDGKIQNQPRCKSWHREGAEQYRFPIGVAARCCRASSEIVNNPYQAPLYVNYGMFFNSASYYDRHNGHCFHSLDQCNNVEKGKDRGPEDGSVPVLCTTYYGQWIGYGDEPGCSEHSVPDNLDCGGWTGKPFGTRYDPEAGCQTGRGEKGYIAQRMGCAGSKKGSMTCMWEEAKYAVLNSATMQWHSRIECPDGYAMADCNGFVDAVNFHECATHAADHYGISYGAFYSHTDEKSTACIAVGSKNDIRAQASCCRIAQ